MLPNLRAGQARSATCCSSERLVTARIQAGLGPSLPLPLPPHSLWGSQMRAFTRTPAPSASVRPPSPWLPVRPSLHLRSPLTCGHHPRRHDPAQHSDPDPLDTSGDFLPRTVEKPHSCTPHPAVFIVYFFNMFGVFF